MSIPLRVTESPTTAAWFRVRVSRESVMEFGKRWEVKGRKGEG